MKEEYLLHVTEVLAVIKLKGEYFEKKVYIYNYCGDIYYIGGNYNDAFKYRDSKKKLTTVCRKRIGG